MSEYKKGRYIDVRNVGRRLLPHASGFDLDYASESLVTIGDKIFGGMVPQMLRYHVDAVLDARNVGCDID